VLLHDNACPHTAAHTVQTFQQLHFDVLEHPPYSPDFALSYHNLFGCVKNSLRGHHFGSSYELKEAVHTWLATQMKAFFSEGIQNLVQC
jgi:hypothetical protein